VASVRKCQKLPPCPMEPMPGGSKADPSLAKAESISNDGSASGVTDLRREKKLLHNSQERGLRLCERSNSADTQVGAEGEGKVLQAP